MSEYPNTEMGKEKPLEYPDDPEAYELRLLEDDNEEYYLPVYEISALDNKKKIGEFELDMIAFCKVKNYVPKNETQTATAGIH